MHTQERTNAIIRHGNNEQQQQKSKAQSGHREKEVVVRNLTEPIRRGKDQSWEWYGPQHSNKNYYH